MSSNITANTGQEVMYFLSNNNGPKNFWENGDKYVNNSNVGGNDWGRVSIGQDAFFNSSGVGWMYEVLCFSYTVSDGDFTVLRNILRRYYTFI